jgi:hypothetical protein
MTMRITEVTITVADNGWVLHIRRDMGPDNDEVYLTFEDLAGRLRELISEV